MIQQFYFEVYKPEKSYAALQNDVHENVHIGKAKNRAPPTYPIRKAIDK